MCNMFRPHRDGNRATSNCLFNWPCSDFCRDAKDLLGDAGIRRLPAEPNAFLPNDAVAWQLLGGDQGFVLNFGITV